MGQRETILMVLLVAGLAGTASAEVPAGIKQALAGRDYATAIAWLEANIADPDAAYELARLYRLGRGVNPDPDRSQALFEQAATAGHTQSQYLLGKHYDRTGDTGEAARWMGLAAIGGHARARDWLDRERPARVADEDVFSRIRSGGVPPDREVQDLERIDNAGRTPLILAAALGSAAWTDYLLDQGARMDARDRGGATALHAAVAARHVQVAVRLLDRGADPGLANDDGNSALHLAVSAGDVELARRMLNRGADPDVRNGAGWSARSLAKRSDNTGLHALFGLEPAGQPAPSAVSSREDAVRLAAQAARRGDEATLQKLLDGPTAPGVHIDDLEPVLLDAAARGQLDVIDLLLRSGVDPDTTDPQQRTALSLAAHAGCPSCVAHLIEGGADREHRDARGQSPLIIGTRAGHSAVVRALADAGVDLNEADALGRNALWWACRSDHGELARELLRLGVPVSADVEQVGPLHLAAGNDHAELVTALVEHAPPDVRTADGSTPLMIAARSGAEGSVQALLAAGAKPDIRNQAGDTALIIAVRTDHLTLSKQLLEAGASPTRRNNRYESAESLMAEKDGTDWAALLETTNRGLFGLFDSASN